MVVFEGEMDGSGPKTDLGGGVPAMGTPQLRALFYTPGPVCVEVALPPEGW